MSIIRVTVRSSGPANSTEQLKIRLREAVANMEVNEQMEVSENRRRKRDSVQVVRRTHSPSRQSSSAGSQISSVSSKDSQMTRYPSTSTNLRSVPPQPYPPPTLVPAASQVITMPKKVDKVPVVMRRNVGPVVRTPAAGSLDEGEYCIKRYRRETRTGDDWEVTKKSHYSYWPPRRFTS